jgi:vitamin K-dependent gamma-carboxylase
MNFIKQKLNSYERWGQGRIEGFTLSLFRLFFGVFLICDAFFFWKGRLAYFPDQKIYFKYPGFEWWPSFGTQGAVIALALLALAGALIALGIFVRWASVLVCFILIHFMLQEASFYLNHLALTLLVSLVLCLIPSNQYFVLKGFKRAKDQTIARYELIWMMGLFLMTYWVGGIEKLRPEWFNGDILMVNFGLSANNGNALAKWFFSPERIRFSIWSYLVIEFLIPFGLFFRKTRIPSVILLAAYHIFNHCAFSLGLFSYLMLASLLLYFDPSSVLALFQRLKGVRRASRG